MHSGQDCRRLARANNAGFRTSRCRITFERTAALLRSNDVKHRQVSIWTLRNASMLCYMLLKDALVSLFVHTQLGCNLTASGAQTCTGCSGVDRQAGLGDVLRGWRQEARCQRTVRLARKRRRRHGRRGGQVDLALLARQARARRMQQAAGPQGRFAVSNRAPC
ncbi:hypothetical protein L1887_56631 [Cichorium endivia]|nr:hypothetical protein L1887_56631 [Cichorium endivia]